MMFLDNKYTKWYYKIIEYRKQNLFEGYTERHHIIPRCMNGSDDADNIVSLSAREHFVCHRLLIKMLDSRPKKKMIYALNRMLHQNQHMQRYCPPSKVYEMIKHEHSMIMKEMWKDESFKKAQCKRNSERWNDEQYRKVMTDAMKTLSEKFWKDPAYRSMQAEKMRVVATNMWKNPDFKTKQSEQRKARWQDPEFREKIIKSKKAYAATPEGKSHFRAMNKKANEKRWPKKNSSISSLEDFLS